MLYARCYKISAQFSCLSQHTKVFNPIVWRWYRNMVKRNVGKISRKKNHHHLLQQFSLSLLHLVFCPPASVLNSMKNFFHPSEIGNFFLIEKMDSCIIYCQTFGAKSYFRNFSTNRLALCSSLLCLYHYDSSSQVRKGWRSLTPL